MFLPTFVIASIFCIGSAICIFAYRFHSSKKRIIIPSAFLIKNFPSKRKSDGRSFPPRLLLELLFLLLLSLAAYFFENNNYSKKELVIFDASLSMSAKTKNDQNNRIKKAVDDFINTSSNEKKYKIIQLPENNNGLSFNNKDEYQNILDIQNEIKNIEYSSLPDLMNLNLSSILSKSNADTITIYTDKNLIFEGEENENIKKINVKKMGDIIPNTYISEISSNKTESGEETLEVKIGFSGDGSSSATITLSSESLNAKKSLELVSKNVNIRDQETSLVTFDLDKGLSEDPDKYYKINISKTLQEDSISLDNTAYWVSNKTINGTIYLIVPSELIPSINNIKESIENATAKKVIVSSSTSKDKNKENTNEIDSFHIYYKVPIPEEISENSLIILPSEDSELVKIKSISKNLKVTSWDQTSFLTKYISFASLEIPQSMVFDQTKWASGVIFNNSGPILLSGIISNKKVIVSGFELLPFDNKRRSASDILLLNIFSDLLQNKVSQNNGLITKEKFKNFICVTGEKSCEDSSVNSSNFLKKGLYRDNKTNKSTLLAVNNLNNNESNTFSLENETIRISNEKIENDFNEDKSWVYVLSSLALAILIFEMILVIVRNRELTWKVNK